jgi:hypothetical protein
MKVIFVLIGIFLINKKSFSQTLICNELCNKTQSLNFFYRASSGINEYLLKKDSSGFDWVTFSSKSKVTKQKLIELSDTLNQLLFKFNTKNIALNNSIDVNLTNSFWHERNYFTIDPKSKKITQLVQVMITFEGSDLEKESENPKVLDVYIVSRSKLKDRKKYLVQSLVDPPPMISK